MTRIFESRSSINSRPDPVCLFSLAGTQLKADGRTTNHRAVFPGGYLQLQNLW